MQPAFAKVSTSIVPVSVTCGPHAMPSSAMVFSCVLILPGTQSWASLIALQLAPVSRIAVKAFGASLVRSLKAEDTSWILDLKAILILPSGILLESRLPLTLLRKHRSCFC